ncbi:MAG: NAD(P)/FAD-dependent oxidoreductase [Acidobacteria bacterium]|nr:NAD(P)/FAD-dependent oxidoreductase [Acidobacteriota bacterium]
MRHSDEFDIVAIGAGPAGATASYLLARWGYRVALVERTRSRRGLAESLPPSATRAFQRFGLGDVLRSRHVLEATGNTSWWDSHECRPEVFKAPGHQIHRPGFDAALASRARQSGVVMKAGTAIKRVKAGQDEAEIEWRSDTGRAGLWRARFVLDCSGRAGVIARRGFRRSPVYHTQALIGLWRARDRFAVPDCADDTHTFVESYAGGWAWSVPISPRVRTVALMTSARATTYSGELSRAPHHGALVAGAMLSGRPWTTDASVYDSSRYAHGPVLLVGDAGSFIDPLSSFGVKKAIMSAWRAAIVVNTVLRDHEAAGEARSYFDEAERDVFDSALRQSRSFFSGAAGFHGSAFWHARVAAVDAALGDAARDEHDKKDEELLRSDPRAAQALRLLKSGASVEFRPGAGVRFDSVVEPDGRTLVRRNAIATDALKRPVRYVAGVELPRLVGLAPRYRQVPDLFEAYNRAAAPVHLHDFLGALSVLIARGALTQRVQT